ncbi:MAG: PEP-CTERM sorting domain-containing protein [Verrucomicrobiota bacterium]
MHSTYCVLLAGFVQIVEAVISIDTDADWNTNGIVNTGDPLSTFQLYDANSNPDGTATILNQGRRSVRYESGSTPPSRPLTQTFQTTTPFILETIQFVYNQANGTSADVEFRIYEVDNIVALNAADDDIVVFDSNNQPDPEPGDLLDGAVQVYSQTFNLGATILDPDQNRVLEISGINGPALVDRSSEGPSAGYAFIMLGLTNVQPYAWAGERQQGAIVSGPFALDAGPYLSGRSYSDNPGSWQEEDDFSLNLSGTVIPEPSAFFLIGIVGAVVSLRRRERGGS